MALLEEVWLCWRNCDTGGGLWGFRSLSQTQSVCLSVSLRTFSFLQHPVCLHAAMLLSLLLFCFVFLFFLTIAVELGHTVLLSSMCFTEDLQNYKQKGRNCIKAKKISTLP